MKGLLAAALLITVALPAAALAGPQRAATTRPGDWELSDGCSFSAKPLRGPSGKDEVYIKCYGITITEDREINVHYEGGHPGNSPSTVATFVIAPGFKGPEMPVAGITVSPGTRDEYTMEARNGSCKLKPRGARYKYNYIQCTATVPSSKGPDKDFIFIGTALFDKPLSEPILRRFEP